MASRLWLVGVAAAVVVGALARIACLNAEFWLDEIWSLELARDAGSPFAVLFRTKHDNNHHLNTLVLHFAPDGVWWGWYRLHSLLAGVLSIVMAARVARRWGNAEAVFASWLVAGCSWFVFASAEARGYALAMLFALIAFDSLTRYLEAEKTAVTTPLVVYWLSTILGFLSHLTFLFATIGFVVWSMRRFARSSAGKGGELRALLVCHGAPGLLLAIFGAVAVLGVEKGGGPSVSRVTVVTSLLSQGLGGPPGGPSALALALLAAGLFTWGLVELRREGGERWLFFVAACVAGPALYLVVGPEYRFERYFFLPFAFFLLLASRALMAKRIRWLGVAVLLAFLGGNAFVIVRFIDCGRGQFGEALAWVVAQEEGETITVSGDHDFRVLKYVRFHGDRLAPGRVRYLEGKEVRPRWFFVHREDDSPPPGGEIEVAAMRYRLVRSYPSRGPGAWGWFVYRREQQDEVRQ